MKISNKYILTIFLSLLIGLLSLQGATIVTSGDISAAATNPATADLGDKSISIGNFTIASTGINIGASTGNLGYQTFSATEFIGVVGGTSTGFVESTEELTLSFTAGMVNLVSLTLGGHGQNDLNAIISGFSSDPGASVTGLPAGWTVSYATGSVTIASNNLTGFLTSYKVDFANPVDVTALEITAPNVVGGAGGIAFVAITYVPEPSTAFIGGLGLLALLRRRRC